MQLLQIDHYKLPMIQKVPILLAVHITIYIIANSFPTEEHLQDIHAESKDHNFRVSHVYRTSVMQREIELQRIGDSLELVTVYEQRIYEIKLRNPDYELSENSREIVAYICEFIDPDVIPLWDTISVVNPYTIRFEARVSRSRRARDLQYRGGHHNDDDDMVSK